MPTKACRICGVAGDARRGETRQTGTCCHSSALPTCVWTVETKQCYSTAAGDTRRRGAAADADEDLPSLAIAAGPGPGQVMLRHAGLACATLAAYEMDVELLFSAQPFSHNSLSGGGSRSGAAGRFSYVRPRASAEVALAEGAEETVLSLVEALPQLR